MDGLIDRASVSLDEHAKELAQLRAENAKRKRDAESPTAAAAADSPTAKRSPLPASLLAVGPRPQSPRGSQFDALGAGPRPQESFPDPVDNAREPFGACVCYL